MVLSDQNPIGQPTVLTDGQPDGSGDGGARTWEEFDSTEPTQASSSAMSANHRGESVNVLKYDGSVTSSFRANIGYDEDCIWTPGGSSNTTGTKWENATYRGAWI